MPGFRRRVLIHGRRCAAFLLAAWCASASGVAQKTGLAFWAPPPSADAAIQKFRRSDDARFTALRQAFQEFHCIDGLAQNPTAASAGRGNAICILPGQSTAPILVIARYDSRARAGAESSWVDAFLLPLLAHAVQAQPRRHTFIFAVLRGDDGEAQLADQLRDAGKPDPGARIVLDGLGFGAPQWYVSRPAASSTADPRIRSDELPAEVAAAVCRAMKLAGPAPLDRDRYPTDGAFFKAEAWRGQLYAGTLLRRMSPAPALLVYSDLPTDPTRFDDVMLPDIHQDLDYVAWLLCFLDVKLDASPAAASAANATSPK
ncbi:MAG: hypothetical protein WA294_06215 [Acidobacteriaceae bacterium]